MAVYVPVAQTAEESDNIITFIVIFQYIWVFVTFFLIRIVFEVIFFKKCLSIIAEPAIVEYVIKFLVVFVRLFKLLIGVYRLKASHTDYIFTEACDIIKRINCICYIFCENFFNIKNIMDNLNTYIVCTVCGIEISLFKSFFKTEHILPYRTFVQRIIGNNIISSGVLEFFVFNFAAYIFFEYFCGKRFFLGKADYFAVFNDFFEFCAVSSLE